MKKNILIDANNLFHRSNAIYVMNKSPGEMLTNQWGYPTGLIYGVYSMLQDWIGDITDPTRLIFFMDGIPKRRLIIDPTYKRKDGDSKIAPGTEDRSISLSDGFNAANEIAVIFRIARYLGIDVYYDSEEEADDLIASFIKRNSSDINIVISSDKDFYQLLNKYPTTVLYRPGVKGNRMFDAERASQHIYELYKVKLDPEHIVMFKALTGDQSDEIKGVPRLRKKSVAPLCKYGTVEELFDTGFPGFSKNEKINTIALKDRIELNLKLIRLNEDIDIDNHLIKSDTNPELARRILEEDLNIRQVSPSNFRTASKGTVRIGPPVPLEDWLSDI